MKKTDSILTVRPSRGKGGLNATMSGTTTFWLMFTNRQVRCFAVSHSIAEHKAHICRSDDVKYNVVYLFGKRLPSVKVPAIYCHSTSFRITIAISAYHNQVKAMKSISTWLFCGARATM